MSTRWRSWSRFVAAAVGHARRIVALPDALAALQAFVLEHLPGQAHDARQPALDERGQRLRRALPAVFGFEPSPLEAVAPEYLAADQHARALPRSATRREGETMAGLTLVIGNKNYSSWSMRPWVLLKQLGIAVRGEEAALQLRRVGRADRALVAVAPGAGAVARRAGGVGLARDHGVR